MNVDTRRVYDVLVVDLAGRLDSGAVGAVGDRLVAIAQGPDKKILVNVEKLDYISSAGLQVLIRAARLLQSTLGELKICNAVGDVKTVLGTTGLDSLIKLYDTEKDAFSAFTTDRTG